MTIRSKVGVFQPMSYAAAQDETASLEPLFVSAALSDPRWKSVTTDEFEALIRNGTWQLAPYSPEMHVVDNKWVFRVKV